MSGVGWFCWGGWGWLWVLGWGGVDVIGGFVGYVLLVWGCGGWFGFGGFVVGFVVWGAGFRGCGVFGVGSVL